MSSVYIKTKDGVYKISKILKNGDILIKGKFHINKEVADECFKSENLKELCDEFVMTHYFPETDYTHRKVLNEDMDLMIKAVRLKKINNKDKELKNEFNIYGCIWVEIKVSKDKSVFKLEPVIIMNDEGNFELI